MNYNLLEERWIPVLWTNAKPGRVGIREALTQAGRIRQVAASNPMDRVAILRFLLAVLYWCKGNPPNDMDAFSRQPFPGDWFKRLDENRDLFNLLGDGPRFYQDRAARRRRPTADLLQEIPTGNNFWHFRHATDGRDGLCPSCCTMGLLRLPLFSVSGLPDLKAGINGAPPVYVVPWGMSLVEALRINWKPCASLGVPTWDDVSVDPDPEVGFPLLAGLTMLSRRVLLHEPVERSGTCIGCGGRDSPLIVTCEFQTAGAQRDERWNDPHVLYLEGPPRRTARATDLRTASKFRMDRPWPDLLTHIAETNKFTAGNKTALLLVVGFATNKALNIDVWERTIALPPGTSIPERPAELLQQWRQQGWRMEKQIARVVRSEAEGAAVAATIRPHIEGRISAKAGELIVGTEETWEQAAREYRPIMKMIARSLSPGVTTAAVERRREIASMLPDMRRKAEGAEKPRKKKGGSK